LALKQRFQLWYTLGAEDGEIVLQRPSSPGFAGLREEHAKREDEFASPEIYW